jgi:hypothetical protein
MTCILCAQTTMTAGSFIICEECGKKQYSSNQGGLYGYITNLYELGKLKV